MHTDKRKNLFFQGGIISLILIILLVRFFINNPYRRQIPDLPDLQNASVPLREQITRFSSKAKSRPTADNLGQLGMVYQSSAYYDEAVQCYKLAVKRSKSKWIWDYYLGYIYKETGESNASIESFRAVIRKNPKVYHARYYLGEGYQNRNLNDKAEAAFRTIVNLKGKTASLNKSVRNDYYPLSTYAKYQLAHIFINTNQVDQAEKMLQEIVQNQNAFGPAYRLLGGVYNIKGDAVLSHNYILRAGDLLDYKQPVDTLIDRLSLISRSEMYILKQIDEAERAVYPEWALILTSNAMRYLPENPYLVSKFIKLTLTMGSGKQALTYLEQHLSSFKDDFNELKQVGDMLYDKGYYSQAINYFKRTSEIKPDDADANASLVLSNLNAGNKQQAMDILNEQLERHRNDPKFLANAVYIMLTMRDKDKAKSFLSKLKQVSPSNPKTYQLAAIIAEQDGNDREALELYEAALKGNPADLVSIQSLDEILKRQKMWSRSIRLLRNALVSHPNEPYLLEKLGTLLVACPDAKLRNYQEGLMYSQRALINKASTAEIMLTAGRSTAEAYAALGDRQSAVLYLKNILDMAQSQNAPREYIEELQARLKQI
jgi:tetratricopeptide (TPR) repeat protein